MKQKARFLKVLSILMLVVFLITNIRTESFAKDSNSGNEEFTIEVEYGLDGITKTNADMPINLTITNNGKDFEGIVRVIIPDSYNDDNNIAYDKNITIAAGTTKNISMSVQGNGNTTSFFVQMISENDKKVYSEKILCNFYSSGDYAVMGILSDDYTALNYFDGVSFERGYFYGKIKIAELNETNLPSTSRGLAVCNYILIDNYNTSKLTDEQVEAIKQWVVEGGVLIFGTGPNYQKVFEKFDDDFINGSIGDLYKENINIVNEYAPEITADLLEIDVEDSSDLAVHFSGEPLEFNEKIIGNGSVVVTNFDFALEPFTSWSNRKDMVSNSIATMGTGNTTQILQSGGPTGQTLTYSTKNYINSVTDVKRPSLILYGLVFLIYVIVIGPVMYLILKAKNKREYMWVTIPILSVIFTIIVSATSIMYRVWQPFASSITVVNFEENAVREQIYGSLQSPYSKSYSVDFNGEYIDYRSYSNSDYNYYYYSEEDKKVSDKYDCIVNESSEGINLFMSKKKAFSTRYFSVNKKVEVSSQDILIDFEYTLTDFAGTVTNNTDYDMENVVVLFNGKFAIIKELKSGESKKISENDLYEYYYAYSIISNYENATGTKYNYNSIERMRLEKLFEMIADSYYVDDGINGIVCGELVNYKQDLIAGKRVTEYNKAIAVKQFRAELPYEELSYYPNILDLVAESNDYDSDGYMYYQQVILNVIFPEGSNIDRLVLVDSDESGDSYYKSFAQISVYNYETWDYDIIFMDGETEITDISKYIDEDGVMLIKCESGITLPGDVGESGNIIPKIAAVGGEE